MQRKLPWVLAGAIGCAAALWLAHAAARSSAVTFLPRHAGADWIVFPKPPVPNRHAVAEVPVAFRRQFVLQEKPKEARLTLLVCRTAHAFVNGKPVHLPPLPDWKRPRITDIAGHLKPGTNEIVVAVTNRTGPPALWLQVDVAGTTIASGTDWVASYAGSVWQPAWPATEPAPKARGNAFRVDASASGAGWIWIAGVAGCAVVVGWLTRRGPRADLPAFPWVNAKWFARAPDLVLLCVAALFLNNLTLIPPRAGFDTDGHVEYIRMIEERGALPTAADGWETHQPPLFYLAGAFLLKVTRTSGATGNGLLVLRAFCMAVTLAHLAVIRVAMRKLFPESPAQQLVGTVLAACMPMQLYLGHYVTNETLAAFLITLSLFFCLNLVRDPKPRARDYVGLGLCLGLALLAKVTAVVLGPFAIAAAWIGQARSKQPAWARVALPGLVLLIAGAVCGWHYASVWRQYGSPIFVSTQWAYSVGWWQDPGYHTLGYFLNWGASLAQPFFSAIRSLPDGCYSTLWGDGLIGGASEWLYRPPWNYGLMRAGYGLALVPTLLLAVGTVTGCMTALNRRDPTWGLLLGFGAALVLAIVHLNLVVPCYAVAKAFYGLSASLPLAAVAAAGFGSCRQRLPRLAPLLGAGFAGWALISLATFFVIGGAAETKAQLGRSLLRYDQTSQAQSILREVLQRHPDYLPARSFLMHTLMRERKVPAALELARETVARHPNNDLAQLDLAIAQDIAGDLPGSLPPTRAAVQLAPDNGEARLRLCARLFRLKRHAEAATAAREALRLIPTDPEVHVILGAALLAESLKEEPALLALDESYPSIADATPREQMARNAAGHFRYALSLAPAYGDALNNLAWMLATHPSPAIRDAREAVNLAERLAGLAGGPDPSRLRTLAVAHAEAGDFQAALAALARSRQAIKGTPPPGFVSSLDALEQLFKGGSAFRDQTRAAND